MKRVITLIMIAGFAPAVVAPVITAAPAQAAGIIECGNWVQTNGQPGTWHWSYGYSIPYSPARNLATRIVSCSDARPFALHVGFSGQRHYRGYICKWHYWRSRRYSPQFDVRCTKGARVIHWQGSAYLR
jgi:hypothetical protein